MKNLLYILFLAGLLSACRSTRLMSLSVTEPAPVTLSPQIKSAGVLNRSIAEGKTRVLDAIDKVVTLEGAQLDKEGSAASISSFTHELSKNDRFTEVKAVELEGAGNTTPGVFPAPLSWEKVDRLCKDNNVDVLFSLEIFDTDSKVSYAAQPVKVNTPLGKLPAVHQQATLRTFVKTGWRIYDPAERIVLDEFPLSRQLMYRASGINPVVAANALTGRKDAVIAAGSQAGQLYAFRVLPVRLRVSRDYYVRGTENFKRARRRAETGNWDAAADLWKEETENHRRKIAGRACYNMAIISEINGELDQAIVWAQRAYEDHNNKLGLRYVRILENRKISNRILDAQQYEEVASGE